MTDDRKTTYSRPRLLTILTLLAMSAWGAIASGQLESSIDAQQVDWPNTTAARYAKAFFDAYNTDGEDALRKFIKEYHTEAYLKENPFEDELASHLQLRRMAGNLEVHEVNVNGDYAADLVTRSKTFGWVKFEIELSPEAPHDVTNMAAKPGSPPKSEAPKEYKNWKDLRDLVERIRKDSGAPGIAAAIVRRGKIVEKTVTGVRRSDRPEPVHLGNRFHIGSITKTITGTMIGKLVARKVLRWDMTVGDILDDIPTRPEYQSVTLEQLLQHRAGVPGMPSTGEFAQGFPPAAGRSPMEARLALVRQILTEAPVNQGEYSYSNAGYVVAGCMAERVTKQSWEELVQTLVFDPLKLQSAGFGWPATQQRTNQPHGHYGTPPDLTVQEIGEYALGDLTYFGPAGDVHCSIEDLATFAAYQLRVARGHEKNLDAETLQRYWRAHELENGGTAHTFFGSGGTFLAMVAIYPQHDLAIVAATNYGLPAMPFLKAMRDAIHQRAIQTPSTP